MCIQSQFSEKTKYDFRTYAEWVPYFPYSISDTATDKKLNWIEKNKELNTENRFFITGRCLPDTR